MTGQVTAAPRWAARLALPGLLAAALAARLWLLAVTPLSYDETHNLMIGMLAAQGHPPYREIYSVIAPFSLFVMQASAALFGSSVWVRLPALLLGLAGVAALFGLVQRQARLYPTQAALLAGTFLAFTPAFFFVSTTINLEAGALALGLLAVIAVDYARTAADRSRAWAWLLLGGAFFGLSTTYKIFVPFIPAIVALQVILVLTVDEGFSLFAGRTWLELVKRGLVWAAGAAVIVGILLLLVDRAAFFDQVLGSRFVLRDAIDTDADVNIAQALAPLDVLQYAPLAIGALAGVIVVWRQRLAHAWIWPAWAVLAALFLSIHDPVRPRHTVTVLPPLAALSGIAVAAGLAWLAQRHATTAQWLNPVLAGGLLGVAVLAPLPLVAIEGFVAKHPVRQAAIDLVQQTTAPDDCIISKENRLIFLAHRLSTPYLSLISTARLFSGLLPGAAIAHEADTHDCPVLVFTETFDQLAPDLRPALADVYALRLTLVDPVEADYPLELFAVQQDTEQPPAQLADRTYGDQIRLRGYDLTPGPWQAGEIIYLSAHWEALQAVAQNYKFFVHLLDWQGNQVAGYDHYPFASSMPAQTTEIDLNPVYRSGGHMPEGYPAYGLIPTHVWIPGQTLKETIALHLPADLASGEYTVVLGLYDEATMQRLAVSPPTPTGQDAVELGTVQVK